MQHTESNGSPQKWQLRTLKSPSHRAKSLKHRACEQLSAVDDLTAYFLRRLSFFCNRSCRGAFLTPTPFHDFPLRIGPAELRLRPRCSGSGVPLDYGNDRRQRVEPAARRRPFEDICNGVFRFNLCSYKVARLSLALQCAGSPPLLASSSPRATARVAELTRIGVAGHDAAVSGQQISSQNGTSGPAETNELPDDAPRLTHSLLF